MKGLLVTPQGSVVGEGYPNPRGDAYAAKINQLIQAGKITLVPGSTMAIKVQHDDECPFLDERFDPPKRCTCDAIIVVG